MLKQRRVLFKSIQRRLYDVLQTRYGLLCFLAGLLILLVFVLQLSDTILEYRMANWRHLASVITLQNASISLSINYHSSHENSNDDDNHIDVVYTWVNGSDPAHLDLIRQYKNHSNVAPKRVDLSSYLNHSQSISYPCYHKLCVQSNQVLVIYPVLTTPVKKSLLSTHKSRIEFIDQYSDYSVIYLDSNTSRDHLSQINTFLSGYKIYMGYYTIDCGSSHDCTQLTRPVYILKKRKPMNPRQISSHDRLAYISNQYLLNNLNNAPLSPLNDEESLNLPEWINSTLISKLDYVYKPPNEGAFNGGEVATNETKKSSGSKSKTNNDDIHLCLIRLKSSLERDSIDSNHSMWDVYAAKLVWDLGDASGEDIAAKHRFEDNDELKYSLRSLERHAPWVRNIYVVTNGQVPSWLDLNHPRIHLVTHEKIFLNKSHLPTFSSPAIESHLHRIKGLSKRFLYFNDDTLLTRDVYLDDFFTESRGYRLRLAWALPGCNAHCPQSWIGDGYCDRACNVTECEMDGGDCDVRNRTGSSHSEHDAAREAFMQQSKQLFPEFYCSPGCSTSWLADKYCDNACNVRNCSYDMGDCGVAKYNEIYQSKVPNLNSNLITLPANLPSFFLNFTGETPIRVIHANFEENQLVRQISIVNKFSIITVLLMPESYRLRVNLPESNEIILNLGVNSTDLGVYNTTIVVKLDPKLNSTSIQQNQETTKVTVTSNDQTTKAPIQRKQVQIKKIDLEPKKVDDVKIKENTIPVDIALPNYENKIFRDLFSAYHSYLNWSFNAGYLTSEGLVYKLNRLDSKIRTEFNKTMTEINEKSDEIDMSLLSEMLSDLDKSSLLPRYLNETNDIESETNNPLKRFNKRKLLDTFADSLKHVNKLYNQLYGYAARKVPAHMPHYIDQSIMTNLQSRFAPEFDRTSSHRFRRSDDMQFAFAYYYFIMSEIDEFDATRLFSELDLNGNELIDASELMLASLRMSDRPFTASDLVPNMASVEEMRSINPTIIASMNSCNLTRIDRNSFLSCDPLLVALKPSLWMKDGSKPRMKYKFEALGDEETKFVMIAGEPIDIEVKLANYMREPRKFLCLNDNIDYVLKNEAQRLKFLLRQFFETLFPSKSSFEIDETLNRTVTHKKAKRVENATHINLIWVFYLTLVFFILVFVRHFVKKCRGRRAVDKRAVSKDCGVSQVIEKKISSLLDDDDDDDDKRRGKRPSSSSSNESSCVLVNERETKATVRSSGKSMTTASKKHSKKKTFVI